MTNPHRDTRPKVLFASVLAALLLIGCGGGGGGGGSASIGNSASTAGGGSSPIRAPQAASISFVSSTPDVIVLQGGEGETQAEITFLTKDSQNKPLAGELLTFELNTSVGGIKLLQTTAITDASGLAIARVIAGNIPTPVRVKATSGSVSAQSGQLSISTGLPHQNGFSIAASNYTPTFYNKDGVSIDITASLSDRSSNAVPDGTVVNFIAEGGIGIISPAQCKTSAGRCTVKLTSSGVREALVDYGRQTILAYALGEESFNDSNSNGVYDAGESFTDLAEAFLNARISLTPSHSSPKNWFTVAGDPYTERFLDINANSTFDAAGNGVFNGVSAASSNPSKIHVRDSIEIIWGQTRESNIAPPGKGATVTDYQGNPITIINNFDLCPATETTASYIVADNAGNPLPGGTTVSFALSAGAANAKMISSITSFTTSLVSTKPETFSVKLGLNTGISCPIPVPPIPAEQLQITITPAGGTAFIRSYDIF